MSCPDIPSDLPTEQRLDILRTHYSFTCSCRLCSADPAVRNASDDRKARIRKIHSSLQQPATRPRLDTMAREFLQLVKEEELEHKLKDYLHEIALAYHRSGYRKEAILFAQAALRHATLLGHDEDDEFQRAIKKNIEVMKAR